MHKYRVMIHGHNFLMEIDGAPKRVGFYTQVFVAARNEMDAEASAVDMMRRDTKLWAGVLNAPADRPSMSVEEIERVNSFDGCARPRTGLAFYAQEQA